MEVANPDVPDCFANVYSVSCTSLLDKKKKKKGLGRIRQIIQYAHCIFQAVSNEMRVNIATISANSLCYLRLVLSILSVSQKRQASSLISSFFFLFFSFPNCWTTVGLAQKQDNDSGNVSLMACGRDVITWTLRFLGGSLQFYDSQQAAGHPPTEITRGKVTETRQIDRKKIHIST